jgi:putative N6-adenine-specific DNA methylase/tRNA (guanine6-N2)-methyltransferase
VSPRTVSIRFTTTPGLEEVAASELAERFDAVRDGGAGSASPSPQSAGPARVETQPLGLDGNLLLHHAADEAVLRETALTVRSCFHVIRHVAFCALDYEAPLDSIREELSKLDIPEMREARRFRVTCNRSGDHEFRSMDVERIAGAALVEAYGTAVDLEEFDTEIRVDVADRTCLVGVQWTRASLDKRYRWVYRPRVTLRTTIAYAMLRFAQLPEAAPTVLDPFCGSGTILIEAAAIRPDARCLGADREPEAVEGTRANAEAAGLASRIDVREADARDLAETYPEASVDALVTNPPYGIRLGKRTNYADLYRKFLSGAGTVVKPGGRLVVLVGKRRAAFNRVLREVDELRILHVRVIEIGGVYPAVFVLKRV